MFKDYRLFLRALNYLVNNAVDFEARRDNLTLNSVLWINPPINFIPPTQYELEQAYKLMECHQCRSLEYPSLVDQLDTIFHNGLDAWKAQIQTVKDKYPKPEA